MDVLPLVTHLGLYCLPVLRSLFVDVPELTAETYVLFEALRDNYDAEVTIKDSPGGGLKERGGRG